MISNYNSVSYPGKIDIPFERLYAPEMFGRVSFPHRDPKTTTYLREDNEFIFSIESGHKYIESSASLEPYGIPFGIFPRILLLLITSYAIYEESREIILSENISKFMRRRLGYDLTGGKNGSLTRLKIQLNRLLNCRLCFRRNRKAQQGMTKKTKDYLNQISKIELWESGEGGESDSQVKATISESYYKWIQKTAFPVDLKTVEAMRSSLLALDLYLFLCSRTYRINSNKYETHICWESLEKQLGANYKKTKEFTRKAKESIVKITEWYPKLDVRFETGRLVLLATSEPHIKSYPQKEADE